MIKQVTYKTAESFQAGVGYHHVHKELYQHRIKVLRNMTVHRCIGDIHSISTAANVRLLGSSNEKLQKLSFLIKLISPNIFHIINITDKAVTNYITYLISQARQRTSNRSMHYPRNCVERLRHLIKTNFNLKIILTNDKQNDEGNIYCKRSSHFLFKALFFAVSSSRISFIM